MYTSQQVEGPIPLTGCDGSEEGALNSNEAVLFPTPTERQRCPQCWTPSMLLPISHFSPMQTFPHPAVELVSIWGQLQDLIQLSYEGSFMARISVRL